MDEAAREVSQAVDGAGARDPQEIREDIEDTRRAVGEAAAALAQKVDVKAQARHKVEEVKERVRHATPDSAGQAAHKARQNRTPLALIGALAAGFLLGRLTARG
jgi:hypothetical protein